ncbi:MAG TPA: glycosyltransferase, partial [Acidimicrobiales bacterium]
MTSLTIVMPVYNEAATLRVALERLLAVDLPVDREVLIVDDGSTDGCMDLIEDLVAADDTIRTFRQEPNQGKGAALRRG